MWGIPSVAGLADLTGDEGPPLVAGVWVVALTLTLVALFVLFHLGAYLAIVYWVPHRRLAAVLLSPLAVGVLFAAAEGILDEVVVVLAGLSYGASVWFPHGPAAWWERWPRLVVVTAAAWVAMIVAVGLTQPRSAGVRTDVAVTLDDAGRTARYRLVCEYDHAGRVRGEVRVARRHPGGRRACEVLDEAGRSLEENPRQLQRGCPVDAPAARFRGRVRGRAFDERVLAGDCEETFFTYDEVNVLLPVLAQR